MDEDPHAERGAQPGHHPIEHARESLDKAGQPPANEREHQRDTGLALLLGAVVVALLIVGYVYLHR